MPKKRRLKELSTFSLKLLEAESKLAKKKIKNLVAREGLIKGIESLENIFKEMCEVSNRLEIISKLLNGEMYEYKKKRDKKLSLHNPRINS